MNRSPLRLRKYSLECVQANMFCDMPLRYLPVILEFAGVPYYFALRVLKGAALVRESLLYSYVVMIQHVDIYTY